MLLLLPSPLVQAGGQSSRGVGGGGHALTRALGGEARGFPRPAVVPFGGQGSDGGAPQVAQLRVG
jgi:hypothetical protein